MTAPRGTTEQLATASGAYHEPTAKRVRTVLGGEVVVDTTSAVLVWEHRYYPQYYVPIADVAAGRLTPTGTTSRSDVLGEARHFTVTAGSVEAVDAAWQYPAAPDEELRHLVRFDWAAMDAWFEEDVEVFVHPRSPYARIDVLDSSRNVRVEIGGVTVAESVRPKLLFETGPPTRYYLPKTDVRLDLLTPTDLVTSCPYKGTARYWSVTVDGTEHPNVVWCYETPLAESIGIAGLVCFYNEKVDLFVDGEPER
jgi:uncharacterized protein (DUF427 family)